MNTFFRDLNNKIEERKVEAEKLYKKGIKSTDSKEIIFYAYEINDIIKDVRGWLQFPQVVSLLSDLGFFSNELFERVDFDQITQKQIRMFQ